jgi:thymidylate kinase
LKEKKIALAAVECPVLFTVHFITGYFRPRMKSDLESGTSLIIDRYAYSGVAFTAAKEVKTFV